MDAEQRAFEAATQVQFTAQGDTCSVADLREAFDAAADPTNWKNPCAAWVHHSRVSLVAYAMMWFHGVRAEVGPSRPIDGWVLVTSSGYAC